MHRKYIILFIILIIILAMIVAKVLLTPNAAKELKGEIVVLTSEKLGDINPDVYGLFMATVFRHFDGGIWAEMLKSRKFAEDDGYDEQYGVIIPWYPIGRTQSTHFMHDNSVYYSGNQSQKIVSWEQPDHEIGIGQGSLFCEQGKRYRVRRNQEKL